MTDHFPISPPQKIVERLQDLGNLDAIDLAYQAGADMELEACVEWMANRYGEDSHAMALLRTARRPNPPSLKEEALETLRSMQIEPVVINGITINADLMAKYDTIRRALEALDD